MSHPDSRPSIKDRFADRKGMDLAMQNAVRDALRRHLLLGESVVVTDERGHVKTLGPDELRRVLEEPER